MKDNSNRNNPEDDRLFDAGAEWFVKKERGLSTLEAEKLNGALEDNPGLDEEISGFEEIKANVSQLPADFVQEMLSDEEPKRLWATFNFLTGTMAALLVVGVSLTFWWMGVRQTPVEAASQLVEAPVAPKTHLLPDGSLIRLNTGSRLQVAYSPAERRIRLQEGEALFEVQSDTGRRFVVDVDGIEIRAVGTAFNVNRVGGIDVIVTQGIVEIFATPSPRNNERAPDTAVASQTSGTERYVAVGQRAKVVRAREELPLVIEVTDMEVGKVESVLNWRNSLLSLSGENLVELAASFEQKTGYRLVIADPSLENLRIGGRFPSNDVFGFLRILQTGYGIPWTQDGEGVITLGDSLEEE